MTSNRLALIFLGFIFLIIVILTSKRIAGFLRSRLGRFIPSSSKITQDITPTPTLTPTPTTSQQQQTQKPQPTSLPNKSTSSTKGGITTTPGEIPATGPNEIIYLVLGSGFFSGLALKKLSSTNLKD